MIINTESHDNWATPKELYDKLNKEFDFDYDPCPLNSPIDELDFQRTWGRSNFINPPYSRKLKEAFIIKAYNLWLESKRTKVMVLLLPVSTSTRIFHQIILPNAEIRFLKGRIKFIENGKEIKQTGTRDSMIVIFKG